MDCDRDTPGGIAFKMFDAAIVEPVCEKEPEDYDGELSGDERPTTMGFCSLAHPGWYSTGVDPIADALITLLNEPLKQGVSL